MASHKKTTYPKELKTYETPSTDEERIDIKFFKKAFNEKQRLEQKRGIEVVNQKINDSLRELCLPKLLCEIAAKPTYMLSDKEKHVLSLLKYETSPIAFLNCFTQYVRRKIPLISFSSFKSCATTARRDCSALNGEKTAELQTLTFTYKAFFWATQKIV